MDQTAFASHTYFHYGIVIENALHNGMNIFHFSSLYYYIIYYNVIYIQLIIISDKLIILHVYICKWRNRLKSYQLFFKTR